MNDLKLIIAEDGKELSETMQTFFNEKKGQRLLAAMKMVKHYWARFELFKQMS